MAAYDELEAADIPTRQAAALTGVSRASAARRHAAPAEPAVLPGRVAVEPLNKLSDAERAHVLEVLNSPRFVDQAPLQIYAQLLDEGVYLCSVSTMYRGCCGRTLRSGVVVDPHYAASALGTVAGRRPTRPGRCQSWSRRRRGRSIPGTSPSSPGRSGASTSTAT